MSVLLSSTVRGNIRSRPLSLPRPLPPLVRAYSAHANLRVAQQVAPLYPGGKTPAPSSQALSNLHEFQFPPGTLQYALSPQSARNDFDLYRELLEEHGILSIQLGFSDPTSSFMADFVRMVGVPTVHYGSRGNIIQDIKHKSESESNRRGQYSLGSSALDEFVWHTEEAHENHPPRYCGFHVIHPDNMGGGVFRIAPVHSLLANLSPATCETLRTYSYRMKVPCESYRGRSHQNASLIDASLDANPHRNDLMRYRGDIIEEPPEEHAAARYALREFRALLANPAVGFDVPKSACQENSILLLDNARFLHMRTPIKDPRRWLRRIGFHPSWVTI